MHAKYASLTWEVPSPVHMYDTVVIPKAIKLGLIYYMIDNRGYVKVYAANNIYNPLFSFCTIGLSDFLGICIIIMLASCNSYRDVSYINQLNNLIEYLTFNFNSL